MKEATKRVVQHLKEVKVQKNLTCQDIADACENLGEFVSLTTIRRIFAKGSEEGADFRPYTINAIFRAVIGTEDIAMSAAEEAALSDIEKEVYAENAALKAVIEMRDATISDLQKQIENLQQEVDCQKSVTENFAVKYNTAVEVFQIAMESLGKSVSQSKL